MDQYTIKRTLLRLTFPFERALVARKLGKTPDAIFIWIPKSAGTSVFTLLESFGMLKFKSLDKTRLLFPGRGMVTFVHQSIPSLIEAGAVEAAFVARAFKFAFVRNPYDRVASLYRYFQKMNRIPDEMTFSGFLNVLEEEWAAREFAAPPPIAEMSEKLKYYGEEFHIARNHLHPIGPYNSLEWSQCRPQIDWLQGISPIERIHIGRVETIDDDFKTILRKLNIQSDGGSHSESITLPRVNTTEQGGGSDWYSDKGLKRIVERVYSRDFELFNY